MIGWALLFFVMALTCGVMGLTQTQLIASEIAWLLCAVFFVLFGGTLFLIHHARMD